MSGAQLALFAGGFAAGMVVGAFILAILPRLVLRWFDTLKDTDDQGTYGDWPAPPFSGDVADWRGR